MRIGREKPKSREREKERDRKRNAGEVKGGKRIKGKQCLGRNILSHRLSFWLQIPGLYFSIMPTALRREEDR